MPQKSALSWWERNALWFVLTLLIAGWWGVLGVLFEWVLDTRVVWFATVNIVFTMRLIVGMANRRSLAFYRVFSLVAQMTAIWFPVMLISFVPIMFLAGFVLASLGAGRGAHQNIHPTVVFALVVGVGTCTAALVSVFKSCHRLMTALETS